MAEPTSPAFGGHTTAGYGTPSHLRPTPPAATNEPLHVWVTTPAGRMPGLLVEWREGPLPPREGRVIHADRRADQWVTVERWIPSDGTITLAT